MLLRHLFRSKELLDLAGFLPIELVLEAFVGDLLLGLRLGFQLLVLRFCQLLLLSHVIALLIEELSGLSEQINLNIKILDLYLSSLDLVSQSRCLSQRPLVILQRQEVLFNLFQVTLEFILLLLLLVFECSNECDLLVVAFLPLLFEGHLLVLVDFVLVVDGIRLMPVVAELFAIAFKVHLLATIFTVGLHELTLALAGLIVEFALVALQLGHLILQDVELRVQNELLTFNLQGTLCHFLDVLVEVSFHLRVLRLQQADVLVGCFIIIVKIADAGFLLVFLNFFAENFELKLHKVDLLLQVDDVIICCVDVGVVSDLAWSLLAFVLAAEVHHRGGLISRTVSERAPCYEVAAAFKATLGYSR